MSKSNANQVIFFCPTTAATLTELERMKLRDGVSASEFIKRAVIAYQLMYPGPDYRPPRNRAF